MHMARFSARFSVYICGRRSGDAKSEWMPRRRWMPFTGWWECQRLWETHQDSFIVCSQPRKWVLSETFQSTREKQAMKVALDETFVLTKWRDHVTAIKSGAEEELRLYVKWKAHWNSKFNLTLILNWASRFARDLKWRHCLFKRATAFQRIENAVIALFVV